MTYNCKWVKNYKNKNKTKRWRDKDAGGREALYFLTIFPGIKVCLLKCCILDLYTVTCIHHLTFWDLIFCVNKFDSLCIYVFISSVISVHSFTCGLIYLEMASTQLRLIKIQAVIGKRAMISAALLINRSLILIKQVIGNDLMFFQLDRNIWWIYLKSQKR